VSGVGGQESGVSRGSGVGGRGSGVGGRGSGVGGRLILSKKFFGSSGSNERSGEKAQNHANCMFGPRRKIFSLLPCRYPTPDP
jgi:hypothetical protein